MSLSKHWEYKSDSCAFIAYSASHSELIEWILQSDVTAQSLVISGSEYRFDFSQMKQIN